MEKIRKYVERFFKGGRCNPHYAMKYGEMIAFVKEFQRRDGNVLFNAIIMLFNYGYAKGYRACKAEQKKARKTVEKE